MAQRKKPGTLTAEQGRWILQLDDLRLRIGALHLEADDLEGQYQRLGKKLMASLPKTRPTPAPAGGKGGAK